MATAAHSPGSRDQIVTIEVLPNGSIQVKPKTFHISKSRDQEVQWVCSDLDAYFTVDFETNGSPFYESQFSKDNPFSGLVRRNVLADPIKRYKYTVRVKDRKEDATLDPDGAVDH